MKNNQIVCLTGAGLDRVDHLRTRPLASIRRDWPCVGVVFWRGKMLTTEAFELAYLDLDHPALAGATPVLLGLAEGQMIFALDLGDWDGAGQDLSELGGFSDRSVQVHDGFDPAFGFRELRAMMADMTPLEAHIAATACGVLRWHRAYRFCPSCGGALESHKLGWMRSCTSCQRPQFPRSDPVVIALVTHQDQVLLGRGLGFPEGLYSILAGFVEPGESIEQAAAREVFEEAGIEVGDVTLVVSQPWPFPASLMVAVRAEATSYAITMDETEMADVRWVSKQDILRSYAGQNDAIKPPRRGAIAHYMLQKWLEDSLD